MCKPSGVEGKDLNLMRSRGEEQLIPTVFYLQTCFFLEVHSLACHIQFLLFIFLWLGEKGCEFAAISWLSAASPISAVVQNWFLRTVLHVLFQVSPDSQARVCGRQQLSPLAESLRPHKREQSSENWSLQARESSCGWADKRQPQLGDSFKVKTQ